MSARVMRSGARRRLAALAVAGWLAAPAAQACDVTEMQATMAEMCDGAIAEVAAVLASLAPRATEAERALIAQRLEAARAQCAAGEPAAGVEAGRLARLAGRLEARLGETPPIWPSREAAAR